MAAVTARHLNLLSARGQNGRLQARQCAALQTRAAGTSIAILDRPDETAMYNILVVALRFIVRYSN